jgi:hypothetical protein
MFIAETVQTFMASSDAFVWFVYGWGNTENIQELNLNWFDIPILTSFVSMTVQCFFAWRVWVLSRSVYIPIAIVLVRLISLHMRTTPKHADIAFDQLTYFVSSAHLRKARLASQQEFRYECDLTCDPCHSKNVCLSTAQDHRIV